MCVDIRTVVRKQEQALRHFRRSLFSAEPTDSGLASVMPTILLGQWRGWQAAGGTEPVRFGPVRSVTDRHAVLTIVGDISDQAVVLEQPGRAGAVLTLSVAARHKELGTRQAVDPGEARAWVEAIAGPAWLPHFYSAGALTGASTGGASARRLTTQYFYLFLGSDGVAHAEPEHQLGMLTPLVQTP